MSTLFEDRNILENEVKRKYGNVLTSEQISKIKKKRFQGWGRLSKEFLTDVKVDSNQDKVSIMDVLRNGYPNVSSNDSKYKRMGDAMVLMEILHESTLGFEKAIEKKNEFYASSLVINELPGSPAVRRTVNQAVRIVDEIVNITHQPPAYIFLESTREDDWKKKAKRTQTRVKRIEDALKAYKAQLSGSDAKEVSNTIKEFSAHKNELSDERLTLYFMQNGKSLYSGNPIDINELSTGKYEVDHILPQCYIVDDSFDNKALVEKSENQRKSGNLLLSSGIRSKCSVWWQQLHEAGLISDKKYKHLTLTEVRDEQLKGFINRQLVETSQEVKFTREFLKQRFNNKTHINGNDAFKTRIRTIKANTSSQLRRSAELGGLDLPKAREANSYHHAHDAFLAVNLGLFISKHHPKMYENPISMTHAVKSYIERTSDEKHYKYAPGSANFVVSSFLRHHGFNEDTGEITGEVWQADAARERIIRSFGYKQCYISRMPNEDHGYFWDQTIYSPRVLRGNIPLKKESDLQKYGNYSSEQFAYFSILEALDNKGKSEVFFVGVPVMLAKKIENEGDSELIRFVRERYAGSSRNIRILRAKVYKGQLCEKAGERFYITGIADLRNATQLSFTRDEYTFIKNLYSEGECSPEVDDLKDFARDVIALIEGKAKSLAEILKLSDRKYAVENATSEGLMTLIKGLLNIANNPKVGTVDISALGGPKQAGRMQKQFSKELTNSGLTFVDQSVTGMFEHRQYIGPTK